MALTKINENLYIDIDTIAAFSFWHSDGYFKLRWKGSDNVDDVGLDAGNSIKEIIDKICNCEFTKIKEDKKRISIDDIYFPENSVPYLSLRCINALKSYEIYYIDELTKITKKDLYKFSNIGKKSLYEIENVLNAMGLKLKEEN